MNTDDRLFAEIGDLCVRAMDNALTTDEFAYFQHLLEQNPLAREYYFDIISTFAVLEEIAHPESVESDKAAFDYLLSVLAEEEKNAEPVEIPRPRSVPMPVRDVQPLEKCQAPTPVSAFSIASFAATAAAILFLMVFYYFAPVRGNTFGRIMDVYQVSLAGTKTTLSAGQTLRDEMVTLESGMLEVQMNSQALIVLEAPATFRLEENNQIFLEKGKAAARVPAEAVGFTVRTPSASIVDYGTEFGVVVDSSANTEAHVRSGQVEMRLGSNPRVFEKTLRLSAHQAGRVSGRQISTVPLSDRQFAYAMPTTFERCARSLDPMMYFRLNGDNADTFQNLIGGAALPVEVDPAVSTCSGPVLDPAIDARALRFTEGGAGVQVRALEWIHQHPQGSYTSCFWVCFGQIQEQLVFAHYAADPSGSGRYYRAVTMTASGQLEHSAYWPGQGKWRTLKTAESLLPQTWYFVVVTNAVGEPKKMYLNGRLSDIDSVLQKQPLERYQRLQFGGQLAGLEPVDVRLGDVLFFNRALSEKEIQQLYKSAVQSRL